MVVVRSMTVDKLYDILLAFEEDTGWTFKESYPEGRGRLMAAILAEDPEICVSRATMLGEPAPWEKVLAEHGRTRTGAPKEARGYLGLPEEANENGDTFPPDGGKLGKLQHFNEDAVRRGVFPIHNGSKGPVYVSTGEGGCCRDHREDGGGLGQVHGRRSSGMQHLWGQRQGAAVRRLRCLHRHSPEARQRDRP